MDDATISRAHLECNYIQNNDHKIATFGEKWFYLACLGANVNRWNLQISDKRTTHSIENTKGGIESGRYGGL